MRLLPVWLRCLKRSALTSIINLYDALRVEDGGSFGATIQAVSDSDNVHLHWFALSDTKEKITFKMRLFCGENEPIEHTVEYKGAEKMRHMVAYFGNHALSKVVNTVIFEIKGADIYITALHFDN